eukprot:3939491-Rhodomonas_salina.3
MRGLRRSTRRPPAPQPWIAHANTHTQQQQNDHKQPHISRKRHPQRERNVTSKTEVPWPDGSSLRAQYAPLGSFLQMFILAISGRSPYTCNLAPHVKRRADLAHRTCVAPHTLSTRSGHRAARHAHSTQTSDRSIEQQSSVRKRHPAASECENQSEGAPLRAEVRTQSPHCRWYPGNATHPSVSICRGATSRQCVTPLSASSSREKACRERTSRRELYQICRGKVGAGVKECVVREHAVLAVAVLGAKRILVAQLSAAQYRSHPAPRTLPSVATNPTPSTLHPSTLHPRLLALDPS